MQTEVLVFWGFLNVNDNGDFGGLWDFYVLEWDLLEAFEDFGDFLWGLELAYDKVLEFLHLALSLLFFTLLLANYFSDFDGTAPKLPLNMSKKF